MLPIFPKVVPTNPVLAVIVVPEIVVPVIAKGVTPPITILSRVPAVLGATVTIPVVVGDIVTAAPTGDSVTAAVADNVVKAPVDGVVAPIVVLLIAVPVGFTLLFKSVTTLNR